MNSPTRWMIGVLVGTAIGAGTFLFLVPDVALAGSLAFVWTVGVSLGIRLNRYAKANTPRSGRWLALGLFVMLVPSNLGLLQLGISLGLRLALELLLIGVGYTGVLIGVAVAVEKGTVSGGDGMPSAGVAELD